MTPIPDPACFGTPEVSIVLPTFNRAHYLQEAVESVRAQTFENWQLIVVDDGSTDETPALLAQWCGGDPRITVLRQENRGQSAARNRGLAKALGRYVVFLDSDNRMKPDALAHNLSVFEAHPEAGVVYAEEDLIDEDGRVVGDSFGPPRHSGNVLDKLVLGNFVMLGTAMVDTAKFPEGLRFDESLRAGEDYDLFLRLAQVAPFQYAPGRLIEYRVGGPRVTDGALNVYGANARSLEKAFAQADLPERVQRQAFGRLAARRAITQVALGHHGRAWKDAFQSLRLRGLDSGALRILLKVALRRV